jgi:phage terminase large subunit GpA-like protein
MKAAQGGFTMLMECVLCYYIGCDPSDQLFISSTDANIIRWAARRLEPAIDSYGLRKHIYAQAKSKGSRKTGDTTFSKEYYGCRLDMTSAQSPSGLRSMDKKILQRDEIDGAPPELVSGEGNWLDVSYARTNFYGSRRKVNDVSTPTNYDTSEIFREYLDGDQRKYLVPCPLCNKKQELLFGNEKTQYGLKPETKAGQLVDAYYICDHCHNAIFSYDKSGMIEGGAWEPSAKSSSDVFRSYHWSALLAPEGALSWLDIYKTYMKLLVKPDGMKAFRNLYEGLPFREKGTRPQIDKVYELRADYRAGVVPFGVLFLTAFVDVQRGSEADSKNPARLELEVCGHGPGYRTWSILYKVIEGAIDDPQAGAWAALNAWAIETGLTFESKVGKQFKVKIVFIDSGDGLYYDEVYRFTELWDNTYPSKGFSTLKKRKGDKEDDLDASLPSNFKRYRAKAVTEAITLYEISTNYYKSHLYNNLKIPRNEDLELQRAGFCEFPIDYPAEYFQMLTAEEKLRDGSFRCKSGVRNEALDCRVGCLCAADVFVDAYVLEKRAIVKANDGTAMDIQNVTYPLCIELMQKEIYGKVIF